MRKSFYHWLMTQRDSKVDVEAAALADLVFTETAFPRQSSDFDQISRYLEEEASFAFNLSQFDRIWETYLSH
ncbi:YozE family protein [Streptococcus sp. NLN76]|uniref:YozE family protein n=1 Tax=Streptococcus sp. NLN76 TaxID=2822800 RepID=UPI0018AA5B2D|nr:YozE family protein [Streptococcus sp. NLN76]MBF8970803.1 YozE family protein [Streptococcus sp. NLN76]